MVKCANKKAHTLLHQKCLLNVIKTSPPYNFFPMELCVLFSEINERGVLRENDYVRQKCELKIEYTYCVLQSGRDSAGSDI